DVRLISATNRNLDEMVAENRFRQDLFFRITGMTISIPPLRERREDIPLLIHYFLQQAAEKNAKSINGISTAAQQKLMAYSWPSNVRQLRNVVQNMVVLATKPDLDVDDLPAELGTRTLTNTTGGLDNLVGISMVDAEKELIRNTLKLTAGNREQAA